jgi:hypothetical protein
MKSKLTLLVITLTIFLSCKKIPVIPETGKINSEYYFKANLNGKAFQLQATEDGEGGYVGSAFAGSLFEGLTTGSLTALLSAANDEFTPQIGIEFGTMKVNYDEDKFAYMKSFIVPGRVDYMTHFGPDDTKKIVIHYTDKSGKRYSSIGPQSNFVTIKEVTALPPQLGVDDRLKIKLTFEGTLYSVEDDSAPLVMTKGEAVVRVENQL